MRKNIDNGSADAARDRMIKRQSGNQPKEVDATTARNRMIKTMTDNDNKKQSLSQEERVQIREFLRMGDKAKIYIDEFMKKE